MTLRLLLAFLFLHTFSSAQYTTVWVRTECDSPVTGYSRLEDILLDPNGQVMVTGSIDTALSVGPVYMAYDSVGQLLWKKSVAGLNFHFSYRLLPHPSGNYIFAGEYEDNTGTNNMLYNELDAAGNFISGAIYNSPGNNTGDDLHDMAIDANGTIYLSGQIQQNSNFYAGIVRYLPGGSYDWMTYHPLLTGWNSAVGRCIEMAGDTGVYQLIFNFTGYGSLAYCDSSGTYQWQTPLPVSVAEYHTQLIVDADGNAIVGGDMGATGGIVKVNGQGDTLWSAAVAYPGLSRLATTVVNLKSDAAGNIYALATNAGNPAYSLIAAFDPAGHSLWVDTLRGYFTLYSRNREFFHLEDGVLTIATNRGTPWLYRYTTSGQRITDAALLLPGITTPEVSAMDYHNGDLYLAGTGYAGFNLRQGFTARLTGLTTGLTEIQKNNQLLVYPVPANEFIRIHAAITSTTVAMVYDYSGRCLLRQTVSENSPLIRIENLSNGMYTLVLQSKDNVSSAKFVVLR